MREEGRHPALGRVANIAVLRHHDMRRVFAARLHIIMTTTTAAKHLAVVKFNRWPERLWRMAAFAAVAAEDMRRVFRRGGDSTATRMTSSTVARRAFKNGINVAGLAWGVAMLADQFKAGGEVVERSAYLSLHGPRQPRGQDE